MLYVEELIGPETVNTMPAETIAAFQDHGEVARDAHRGRRRGAEAARASSREAGVDYDDVVDDARGRGRAEVRRLVRGAARRDPREARRARGGVTTAAPMSSLVERIWAYDASVWTGADEDRWLGWLDVVDAGAAARRRAERVRARPPPSSSTTSSCSAWAARASRPRCSRRTFGVESFHVLDTTHPAAIRRLERSARPRADALPRLLEVGLDARDALAPRLLLGAGRRPRRAVRRDHRSRLGARAARAASAASAPSSPASRRSAAATRRSRCSGSCRRR